jgi:hypothetical protein
MGIPSESIVEWAQNGIEYYYPESILDKIFPGSGSLEISDDRVSRGDVTYTKFQLAEMVAARVTKGLTYPKEFEQKLLQKLGKLSG